MEFAQITMRKAISAREHPQPPEAGSFLEFRLTPTHSSRTYPSMNSTTFRIVTCVSPSHLKSKPSIEFPT